ncbi:MAG: hypothetical protein H6814_10975 [Phycisphaeraceae bacterium]|nr:hypothetical protein [Phycisphaeraceae bacterium]
MTAERDDQISLSPEGERRRAQIGGEIAGALPGIAARRRSRRRAIRGTLALALLVGVWAIVALTGGKPIQPPAPPIVVTPAPEQESVIDYAVVRSGPVDPSIYIRTDTAAINAMVISDDELLRELAAAGRPAGLIRVNGQTRLSRDVVDPPL